MRLHCRFGWEPRKIVISLVVCTLLSLAAHSRDYSSSLTELLHRELIIGRLEEQDLLKSLPRVIVIFESCCKPNQQAIRWAAATYSNYKNKIDFIGIDIVNSRKAANAKVWLVSRKVEFPVIWDPSHDLAKTFNTVLTPTIIILDEKSEECLSVQGFLPGYEVQLNNKIVEILNK